MPRSKPPLAALTCLPLLLAAACAGDEADDEAEQVALAQRAVLTPGGYGPEYAEPGFSEKNSYFSAGFQATVNHFGGNLIVTAPDVEIPSQGRYGLRFTRAYNSNVVQLQNQAIAGESDGPLGQGWTGHYGLLFTAAPNVFRPMFIDSTGARHLFYPHNVLGSALGITSPGSNPTYISSRMEILRWIDADHWELHTPEGLRYELTRLPQYGYLVTTRISDVHGNSWRVGYEPDANPYVQHPLPSWIEDGLNRRLVFAYVTRSGKRRLDKVSLGNATLASYSYTASGGHDFLWKHTTGAGRVTEYTTDTGPYPRLGTITAIKAPTGGVTRITYQVKTFYYRAGNPQTTYSVTRVERGGHTWDYDYLSASSSAPANDEFRVRVTTTGFTGTYAYYTYGSGAVCNGNLWKVGMLLRSEESFGGATRVTSYDYARHHVANATGTDRCDLTVGAPRKLSETTSQDGFALVTTYSQFDALNFPARIDAPGGVRTDLAYQHVVVGGSSPRLLLGLPRNREVRAGGALVERTEYGFAGGAVVPTWVRFYRTPTSHVQASLTHWTQDGKAGSLREKAYGRYYERYDYQNGVLKSIDYPTGPDLTRSINTDGTIASETKDGVTRGYLYDRDFRPTRVDQPGADADTTIAYGATVATVTTGIGELRLSYDAWGRLIERREKIASGQFAVDSMSQFDPMNRPTRETVRTGAVYDVAYDVFGRQLRRSAPGDTHVFGYATSAAGVLVTETQNGTLVRERRVDHLGRLVYGSTNGRRVDHVFTAGADGVTETITPQGLPARTVRRDFLGNKLEETHPETGRIQYPHTSAEAWLSGIDRPGLDHSYTLDARGRVTEVKVGGATVASWRYHASFGSVDRTEHRGVVVEHRDHDPVGRPRTVITTIPRALPPPLLRSPSSHQQALPPPGSTGYFPYFIWDAVPGAASYEYELYRYDRATRTTTRLLRGSTPGYKLYWPDAGFTPSTSTDHFYHFRVRTRTAAGEVGAFSTSTSFYFSYPGASPANPPPPIPGDNMPPPPPNWQEAPPHYPPPITTPVVYVTRLEYDQHGRIAVIRHPDADFCRAGIKRDRVQELSYNGLGGADRVSIDKTAIVTGTSYHASGLPNVATVALYDHQLISLTEGKYVSRGTVYVRKSFDALGRLTDHRVDNGETTYYRASNFSYDDWGFVSGYTRSDPGLSASVGFRTDSQGRLDRFSIGNQTVSFSYDAASNLTAHGALSLAGLWAYGFDNAPAPATLSLPALASVSYTSANRRAAWGYDADGRVIRDDDWEYEYDSLEQVAAVREGAWIKEQILSDADGNRVRDVHDGVVTYTVRLPDGRVITFENQRYERRRISVSGKIEEYLVCAPSLTHDLVWHNGQAVLELISHDWEWVWQNLLEYAFRDRLGSPALVMSSYHEPFDPRLEKQLRLKYLEHAPYGQQMRSEVANRFVRLQFSGHEYDTAVDRYDMRARHYDPGTGRFLRPDPAFDVDPINPASYNLYAYARSHPIGFTDPTGLDAEPAGEGEACPVQLCQRAAELPGGWLMDKVFGSRHWWIKTPNLETGMGKRGAGVPGLRDSEVPMTLMTTMNDHSGQADAPESQCRAICGVDLARVEHLARTGRPTGVWIPLVNDCNNVVEDILRQSGNPQNMPSTPGHIDWVHEAYLGAERAVRSFGQWLEIQLYFNAAAPWQPFGRL